VTFLWIAPAALLVALLPLPYGGYQLVKCLVTLSCAVAAYRLIKRRKLGLGWTCVAIAALFNPIVPFYFTRGIWITLDLAAAAALGLVMRSARSDESRRVGTSEGPASHEPEPPQEPPAAKASLADRLGGPDGDRFARSIFLASVVGLAMVAVVVLSMKR